MRTSLVSMFLAITCLSCLGIHDVELARLASPDGRVEAVFIQNADYGGITTGFTYCLYIVKKGGDPEQGDYLMTVDRIEDFEFYWREDKHLEIQYRYARIWHFTNWWCSPDVDDFRYVVELHLRPLGAAHSLPRYDLGPDTTDFELIRPSETLDTWIDTLSDSLQVGVPSGVPTQSGRNVEPDTLDARFRVRRP